MIATFISFHVWLTLKRIPDWYPVVSLRSVDSFAEIEPSEWSQPYLPRDTSENTSLMHLWTVLIPREERVLSIRWKAILIESLISRNEVCAKSWKLSLPPRGTWGDSRSRVERNNHGGFWVVWKTFSSRSAAAELANGRRWKVQRAKCEKERFLPVRSRAGIIFQDTPETLAYDSTVHSRESCLSDSLFNSEVGSSSIRRKMVPGWRFSMTEDYRGLCNRRQIPGRSDKSYSFVLSNHSGRLSRDYVLPSRGYSLRWDSIMAHTRGRSIIPGV